MWERSIMRLMHISVGILLASTLTGCGSNAGTAVAVTGGALLGTGLLAQAATGVKVDVKVDVYKGKAFTAFTLGHAPAIATLSVDPAASPTVEGLSRIVSRLAPLMTTLQDQSTFVEHYANQLSDFNTDDVATQTADDLRKLLSLQKLVSDRWTAYHTAVESIRRGPTSPGDLDAAAQRLTDLRAALSQLQAYPGTGSLLGLVKTQLPSVLARPTTTASREATPRANRVQDVFGTEFRTQLAQQHVSADEPLSTQLQALRDAAHKAAQKALPGDAAAVKRVDDYLDKFLHIPALAEFQGQAARAGSATFDSITSSANFGTLSNEVTQDLLTPSGMIATIADADEEKWKPFCHCSTSGGQGNTDAVLYMENQAKPVLKSVTYDPTQFIAADGALYRDAFAVLQDTVAQKTKAAQGGGTTPGKQAGDKTGKGAATPTDATTGGSNSDATKRLNDQVAAVKKAKIAALEAILDQQQSVVAAAKSDDQWQDVNKQKSTIDAVRKALKAQAAGLRTSVKQGSSD